MDLIQSLERKGRCLPSPIPRENFQVQALVPETPGSLPILDPPFRSHFISFTFVPCDVEKLHISSRVGVRIRDNA